MMAKIWKKKNKIKFAKKIRKKRNKFKTLGFYLPQIRSRKRKFMWICG